MVAVDGRRPPTTNFARVMLYSHQDLRFCLALVRRIAAENGYWIPGCASLLVYGEHRVRYVHHADHEDANRQTIPLEHLTPQFSPTGKFVIDIFRTSGPSKYTIIDVQTSKLIWGPYLHGRDPRQVLHITQGKLIDGSLGICGAHKILAWLPSGLGVIACGKQREKPALYCSMYVESIE